MKEQSKGKLDFDKIDEKTYQEILKIIERLSMSVTRGGYSALD